MIAGLGDKSDFVATVPNVDVARLDLTREELDLFSRVGRVAQISWLLEVCGLPEPLAIALLLSLRAKGAVVPARVQKAAPPPPGNAAALGENVELSDERKRDILEMEIAVEVKNHFELLGVAPDATPEAIRKSFFELSLKFHPDRYFQKNLGSYRARIELVFRKLSLAYETLSDDVKRKAYLKANPGVVAAAAATAAAAAAAKRAAATPAPAPKSPTPVPKAPEPPKPRTAEDDARDAERRSRFARHPYFAKGARTSELLSRAKEHIAKGDFGHAFTDLHMAHQIDAKNEEVKHLLAEVRVKNDAARAAAELKRGLEELDQGKETAALAAFKSAVHIDPKNARAAYMAAKLTWDKSGDSKESSGYAQKAVDADPKNPDAHVLLALILDAAGMKANAKRHFEEALKLDPKHPEAKKHVKGRWPF